jgi:hypothetical protein
MFFGIRDPGSGMGKNPDPGSGINIPDPQHWLLIRIQPDPDLFARSGSSSDNFISTHEKDHCHQFARETVNFYNKI